MELIRTTRRKVAAVMCLAAIFVMSVVSMAAAVPPEYDKLTEGVENEFLVIVPIVLAVLGAIIGIAFAIRWGVRKFGGTR